MFPVHFILRIIRGHLNISLLHVMKTLNRLGKFLNTLYKELLQFFDECLFIYNNTVIFSEISRAG